MPISTYDTLELALASTSAVGDIVEVLGFYAAGDGGGFRGIVEASNDLYPRTAASVGRIKPLSPPCPRIFGAKGDGVTDDTDSIQKAINFVSHFGLGVVPISAGHFKYARLYFFYDLVLNPHYWKGDNRHGMIKLEGAGRLDVSHLRTYRPTFGTILECTVEDKDIVPGVTNPDIGLVVSSRRLGHGERPFPARGFETTGITYVSNNSKPVIEIASCPSAKFKNCSILQRGPGSGVRLGSAWFASFADTQILNTFDGTESVPSVTGDGIIASSKTSAGLYDIEQGCLIDGFRNNIHWTGGVWNGMKIQNSALQRAVDHNIRISVGPEKSRSNISMLQLENVHFEGVDRKGDVRIIGSSVTNLEMSGCYHLAGTKSNGGVDGPLLHIDEIGSIILTGNFVRRPWQTYCSIGAARNGKLVGTAHGCTIVHDNAAAVTGPVYLFDGIVPKLENITWKGMGAGIQTASSFGLYDPNTVNTDFIDTTTGVTSLARPSLGPVKRAVGQSGVFKIANEGDFCVYDIENTNDMDVELSVDSRVPDGRWYRIKNDAGSVGTINVITAGDATSIVLQLSPNEWADFVLHRDTGSYSVFKG